MKHTFLVLSFLVLGCSGPQIRRTLETDPVRRVFIDPKIDVAHYTEIRRALVETGKFEVVDRSEAFEAAFREQELQHAKAGQRFANKEKWSWVGEFYGAAAVIQANASCWQAKNFWGTFTRYCRQTLSLIDTTTGVVVFSVVGENSIPWTVEWVVPDWDETVAKAADAYPVYFKPRIVKAPLKQYMDQSEERAKREQENRTPAANTQLKKDMMTIQEAHDNYINQIDASGDVPVVERPQPETTPQPTEWLGDESPPKVHPKSPEPVLPIEPRAKGDQSAN
jgi:hypothetical protein